MPQHGVPHAAPVLFLLSCTLLAFGCHDDHGDPLCDDDGQCVCNGRDDCEVECEGPGCSVDCDALNGCDAACGDDCQVDCDDLDHCDAQCGADCRIDCTSLSECNATCGERCTYNCNNASTCAVVVGPSSSVDCQSVGSCRVDCEGACEVDCESAGACDIHCIAPDGEMREPQVFDHTRFVCG